MISTQLCLGLLVATAFGCSRSDQPSPAASAHDSPAVAADQARAAHGCAVGSASTFKGDTTLFGARNECGRWTATPAQRDSAELLVGFRDSVRFALADCPALQPVDSLIFGTIEFSSETGDASGSQLVFQRSGAWLRGVSLEGAGGISPPVGLRGLTVGPMSSQLSFWVPSGGRTILRYAIRLTCKNVTGTFRFRNFADARYDDGGSLSDAMPISMARSAKAITKFP